MSTNQVVCCQYGCHGLQSYAGLLYVRLLLVHTPACITSIVTYISLHFTKKSIIIILYETTVSPELLPWVKKSPFVLCPVIMTPGGSVGQRSLGLTDYPLHGSSFSNTRCSVGYSFGVVDYSINLKCLVILQIYKHFLNTTNVLEGGE